MSRARSNALRPARGLKTSSIPRGGISGLLRVIASRPLDSITGFSGILDRPVQPGDDDRECGAPCDCHASGVRSKTVIARSEATKQSILAFAWRSGLLRF